MCVILNRSLLGVDLFTEFVEDFKKFEANYCCLPSKDTIKELHRAFYYVNVFDYQIASDIIERNIGIKAHDYLKTNLSLLYSEKF